MLTTGLQPSAQTALNSSNGAPLRDIHAAAREFEKVLLGQWLQGAETSFASVPGGDADADSGAEQMRGFATDQLAGALAHSGGIGIGALMERALRAAAERETAASAAAPAAQHATGAGK